MGEPHQCRCAICGEIGTIVPALPTSFLELHPGGEPIVHGGVVYCGVTDVSIVTCTHGYTVCAVCKFPAIASANI